MSPAAQLSPLIEQYEGVKARYPGHLLLFRVGDFYETFGEDAKLLSRELEVVLTARAADGSGERLPMAGVPHHAVDSYLARLVRKGYKVALCDQVEDARLAKGLVRRDVTRVVTPGTIVEERILPGPENNFLACVHLPAAGPGSFVAVDVTTGEWVAQVVQHAGIEAIVASLSPFGPREVLIAPAPGSPPSSAELILRREFPSARVETRTETGRVGSLPAPILRSLAATPEIGPAAACLAGYLEVTQPRLLPFLEPVPYAAHRRLALDAKTLRHLEITRSMNPDDPRGPTLLSTWDVTITASGHRTLSFWLRNPLADADAIRQRQEAVEALRLQGVQLSILRTRFARIADLSRIGTRLVSRRLRPGELNGLRESLAGVGEVRQWLDEVDAPASMSALIQGVDPLEPLQRRLDLALPEGDATAAPASDRRFRTGYSAELDRWSDSERTAIQELEALERSEQAGSGIRSLKIGYNQVFGYYFEISRANLSKAPSHFRRKQTLAQGERFTSDALAALEERILVAREEIANLGSTLWEQFLTELEQDVPALHRLSRAVGELDVLASFAHLGRERGYVRPLVEEGRVIQIRDGRHPVLDRTLPNRFVPNDADLDAEGDRMWVLTGPNMSGKSTYMRQIGLLVVLAQVGASLPVKYARIGVVGSLYTRMGFTDEIGRGKSSFMVEMSEVAEILRSAGPDSLVLLDEVGRGTSTFDGLALAWSTIRYLHDSTGCRTLLATHYHQLTELVERLSGARNGHMAVREEAGEITFLYRLVPGSTDQSFGLHVARLAGLPSSVLEEAARVLRQLESEGVGLPPTSASGRRAGPRYTQAVLLTSEPSQAPSPLVEALRELDVDSLTPMEALRWIAEWRHRLGVDTLEPAK
jgi:DNA mismatch repair protein MutS